MPGALRQRAPRATTLGSPLRHTARVTSPNAEQLEYWNGPAGERWAANHAMVDRNLAMLTEALFAAAAAAPGERVLDIGCGCGTTTLRLRERVEPAGRVVGVDVSAPQLAFARGRTAGTDLAFIEADASAYAFAPEFDLLCSRFGVMFFADPTAGFANLRRAVAPGGRLAFMCWRVPADNPWWTAPVAAAFDLLPEEPPPEPHAPGAFAFADPDRIRAILTGAGFGSIAIDPFDGAFDLGPTVEAAADEVMSIGGLARRTRGLDPDTIAQIRARMPAALAPFQTPRRVAPPAGVWIVTAR